MVPDGLPVDWGVQVVRAYTVFGVVPVVDEFGWKEWLYKRKGKGKGGGQFEEKPGAFLPEGTKIVGGKAHSPGGGFGSIYDEESDPFGDYGTPKVDVPAPEKQPKPKKQSKPEKQSKPKKQRPWSRGPRAMKWDDYVELSAEQKNALSSAEAASLQTYIGSGHLDINGALRGKRASTPKIDDDIRNLDRIFDEHATTLPHDIVVWRGSNAPDMPNIRDNGYVSTSIKREVAATFSQRTRMDEEEARVLDIVIPAGTPFIFGKGWESEVILERASVLTKPAGADHFGSTTYHVIHPGVKRRRR